MIGTAAAILGAAAIGGGATLAAGKSASNAAKKATAAQAASDQSALDLQRDQYNQTRADQEPWRQVGLGALQQLASTYNINVPQGTWSGTPATGTQTGAGGSSGQITNQQYGATTPIPEGSTGAIPGQSTGGNFGAFFASPDYQFRLDQGTRAVTANRAARGLMDSGSLGTGLIDYAGKAASQEYGNWFGRLSTLAGYGAAATNAVGGAGAQYAANAGGIMQNAGANRASGYLTQGAIQKGVIGDIGGQVGGLIKNWPTGGYSGPYQGAMGTNVPSNTLDGFEMF